MTVWVAVLMTAAGCYGLKLLGLLAPARLLEHPLAARVSALLPVAVLDARLAGVGAAVVAIRLRAPFLVVVAVAAATAALVRLV
jgi:hypothetical protein